MTLLVECGGLFIYSHTVSVDIATSDPQIASACHAVVGNACDVIMHRCRGKEMINVAKT
eukprot:m.492887 g.492887  ORF g.492887 m.492887 type:complete len:59 (+) comp21789_c0_seq2:1916-2092(+)